MSEKLKLTGVGIKGLKYPINICSDLIVDITKTYRKKVDAMQLCKSQVEVFPGILDYLKALARVRGFLAEGEAFE